MDFGRELQIIYLHLSPVASVYIHASHVNLIFCLIMVNYKIVFHRPEALVEFRDETDQHHAAVCVSCLDIYQGHKLQVPLQTRTYT